MSNALALVISRAVAGALRMRGALRPTPLRTLLLSLVAMLLLTVAATLVHGVDRFDPTVLAVPFSPFAFPGLLVGALLDARALRVLLDDTMGHPHDDTSA